VTYLVLEHVEQRGLAGVVEAEEEDLGLLLPEPQGNKQVVKPIYQKHRRRKETGTAVGSLVSLGKVLIPRPDN